jgi:hypothetical protein
MVRSNPFTCATSLHSIFSFSAADPTNLMVRQLSCFCPPCIDQDWDNCESKDHVKPWRCVKLKPSNTSYVQEQMVHHGDDEEWEFGGDGEELSDLLNIVIVLLFLQKVTIQRGSTFTFFNVRDQNLRLGNHLPVSGDVILKLAT